MFKISTKGDYGLLLLSALAKKAGNNVYVSLGEIAKEQNLSLAYLSQIIAPLKRAGLVVSREGKTGGYKLAKPAGEITMMKVLETLEGPVIPVKCCNIKGAKCGIESQCAVKSTWLSAQKILNDFLKGKTLADLC